MKKEIIKSLTKNFESYVNTTENGVEFWFARDLQQLLGYTEWRDFLLVAAKAKIACETAEQNVKDHFVGVNKMVKLGSGSEREIEDIMLTRYACAGHSWSVGFARKRYRHRKISKRFL